jgi:hypothetical protein
MASYSFLLDKSVFVAISEKELCKFVSTHTVILPETLFYECYTNNELPNKKYLKRLYQLLKNGAYVTYQLMQIIAEEGKNLSPCTCIVDYSKTDNLCTKGFREEKTIKKAKIDEMRKDRSKLALSLKRLASKIVQNLKSNKPDYIEKIRSWNMSREERFRKYIEEADKNDIHDLATESFRKYVTEPKRFCLSSEWLSWHWARLLYAKAWEYCYLEITETCPSDEHVEHDLMDVEYLTFLAKCNALLTGDKRFQSVTAEVAFPNKKIYSSIQEVHV